MAIHHYEEPKKKEQLVRDFERMGHFLEVQHDVFLAQGHEKYAEMCREGCDRSRELAHELSIISRNPVTMFTGDVKRQANLASIVDAINPVLGLPEGHAARTDPTMRATVRRMQNFIDWLYDDGNCGKPVRVTEFNLKSGVGARAAPAIALGLIPPETATLPKEPVPASRLKQETVTF